MIDQHESLENLFDCCCSACPMSKLSSWLGNEFVFFLLGLSSFHNAEDTCHLTSAACVNDCYQVRHGNWNLGSMSLTDVKFGPSGCLYSWGCRDNERCRPCRFPGLEGNVAGGCEGDALVWGCSHSAWWHDISCRSCGQGMGKKRASLAVGDLQIDEESGIARFGNVVVGEHDWISINGTTGEIIIGKQPLKAARARWRSGPTHALGLTSSGNVVVSACSTDLFILLHSACDYER